jgi:O-antigen/teichoic acid export membrane protein
VFQKLKALFLDLVVYGTGDVATHLVGFLLLPLFTNFLAPEDYGVWSLLLTASLVAKIVFRWGVDASFMRFFYDCEDDGARQRLASTIFFFLLAANGAILLLALVAAPLYSQWLFRVPGQTVALQLMLASTFVGGFFFLPFHVFRIRGQARQFALLTFTRSVTTLLTRIGLVLVLHFGVIGLVLSEFFVTLAFALVLLRWFAPLVRPVFSRETLREVLRFGLPRVPHGIAQQIVGPTTDAYLMQVLLVGSSVARLGTIGLYQVGSSLGLALKFFLSAFEYAWAPFYFQTMKEKDAQRTFATITTYGFAILVLMSAGLSAVATDLVRLMTKPLFHQAAVVIPWISIAVTLQGVYLLTSIGMNITKHTEYYPVAAGAAAASNIIANIILIPRYGILGPAWSNVVSYAVLAGVAFVLSQRFYPIRYEYGRVARVVVAGVVAYLAAVLLVPGFRLAVVGVLVRGITVLAVYPAILGATGFFHVKELARMRALVAELRSARGRKAAPGKSAPVEASPDDAAVEDEAAATLGFEQDR